jgi:hypothetical protein
MAWGDAIFQAEQIEIAGSDRPSADPSCLVSVAANAKTTESLFAYDHEPFFNTIDRDLNRSTQHTR